MQSSNVTRSTLKLGIYLGNHLVLIEGHIVLDQDNIVGPNIQSPQPGVPIFIREGAGINSWYAAIGNGSHHMTSSQIYNSGSLIRLETNTQVTGSLNISAGITGSLFGNATTAATADTLSSFADVDKINTGDPSDVFIRPNELEQSKYATLNIYNYTNFT